MTNTEKAYRLQLIRRRHRLWLIAQKKEQIENEEDNRTVLHGYNQGNRGFINAH